MTHRAATMIAIALFSVATLASGEVETSKPATQPTTNTWVDAPPIPASELPDLTTSVQQLLNDLADSDEPAVASRSLLPIQLSHDDSLLYARRLILSSRLHWLLVARFGEKRARVILFPAKVEYVPWIDPDQLSWRSVPANSKAASAGATELMIGTSADRDAGSILMFRTSDGWKLNRNTDMPALVMLDVDDAEWRCALLSRAIAGVRSGKLKTPNEITDALLPHAPATRPTTASLDRSTPEGAVATFFAGIESGDAKLVADSLQYPRENEDNAKARQQFADRLVAGRTLAKTLREKFGDEQSARIVRECYLMPPRSMELYKQCGWAVDGDVARAVLPQHWYNVAMRMMRRGGVWRICWMAGNDEDQKSEADRAQRDQQVLKNLDKYATPGAVFKALNDSYAQQPDRVQSLKTMRQQLADAERQAATQPAQSADEQFHRDLGMLYGHVAIALLSENPQEAAKYYYAEGDDGSYTVARERRALAASDLADAAGAEVGAGPGVTLTNLADDLYGLIMVEWSVTDDAAISKGGPDGAPTLRKIDGIWRIDVSPETNGDPMQAAKEAENDAGQIVKLTARVKKGEFKTAESFHQAVRDAGIKGFAKPQ